MSKFSDNEYTVVGFKSTDKTKTNFKLVPKDVSTVPVSDICAILPNLANENEATQINFGKGVEVFEFSKSC